MREISPKARVYEVMRRYPETTDYFLELGLCGCSFGESPGNRGIELTLEELAREKGLDLKKLLEELNRRI
jgi:hypothetical protein